jgi:hypothetical protein
LHLGEESVLLAAAGERHAMLGDVQAGGAQGCLREVATLTLIVMTERGLGAWARPTRSAT